MGNKVFYDSNKQVDIKATMRNVQSQRMGETRDGCPIYHWTYYDESRNAHISYDTVVVRGEHLYILGSGHTTRHGGRPDKWDWGRQQTWREAQHRYSYDIIK